jgi:hypothetical protein
MIFQEIFGIEELERQLPLSVTEASDRWIIEGSRSYDYTAQPENQLLDGKLLIEIAKKNCAILRLSKMVDFAKP